MYTIIKQKYKKHKKLKYLIIVCAFLVFLFRLWLLNSYREEDYVGSYVTKRRTNIIHEPKRVNRNIFFVETSCASGTGSGGAIGLRQACAVESAARTNPDHAIYLLHTCAFHRYDLPDYVSRLMLFPNVRFLRIEWRRFVEGTPVEGRFPLERAGDVLRLVTLWKYGGTSVDLDFLVLRSLNGLGNFVGAESNLSLTDGIMNFEPYGVGHDIVTDCLEEISSSLDGREWAVDGPVLVARVLQRRCGGSEPAEKMEARCGGFSVLSPETVSPIPWALWPLYFAKNSPVTNLTLNATRQSVAVRVGNTLGGDLRFRVDSNSTYMMLAERYCPAVYKCSGF